MIGPARARFYALLVFLVVCAFLAVPAWAAEPAEPKPRHLVAGYDYYTCEFLGYCPQDDGTRNPYVPEMWETVKCYPAVGKLCPDD